MNEPNNPTPGGMRRRIRGIGVSSLAALMFALAGVTVAGSVGAQEIGTRGSFKPTAQDLALLPPYCRARVMPSNSSEAKRWAGILRDGWNHVHHYCLALNHLNDIRLKGFTMSARERRSKLKRVVAEIGYVERRVNPGFPLWNEMMQNKAQANAQLAAAGVR